MFLRTIHLLHLNFSGSHILASSIDLTFLIHHSLFPTFSFLSSLVPSWTSIFDGIIVDLNTKVRMKSKGYRKTSLIKLFVEGLVIKYSFRVTILGWRFILVNWMFHGFYIYRVLWSENFNTDVGKCLSSVFTDKGETRFIWGLL